MRNVFDLPGSIAEQLVSKIRQSSRGSNFLPDPGHFPVIRIAPGKAMAGYRDAILGQLRLSSRFPVFFVE